MPTALITGASRGIGRATALSLAGGGWDVYAGVRRIEDGESLADEARDGRIVPIILDVTDSEHLARLTAALPGQLDAVINNAGVVVDGPIEALGLDDLRHQLEVNLVGQVAVTQAVLPQIRARRGRIIFISSVSGRVATPMMGAYIASKFAIEGLADAMRIELAPWGIKVILIQPNSTDTDLWRTALDQLTATETALSDQQRQLYAQHFAGTRRTTKFIQKQTVPVQRVVTTIEHALTAHRPRARYPVGALSKVQLALNAVTPTRMMDTALARISGIPRKAH
jgi:NAD(P)-dependent dehydrogenase (short-subunit alcohol dehydrogenase family)